MRCAPWHVGPLRVLGSCQRLQLFPQLLPGGFPLSAAVAATLPGRGLEPVLHEHLEGGRGSPDIRAPPPAGAQHLGVHRPRIHSVEAQPWRVSVARVQLHGNHGVAELAELVGAVVRPAARHLEVRQGVVGPCGDGRGDEDAASAGRAHVLEQKGGQQERRKDIHRQRVLVALFGDLPTARVVARKGAGIVEQPVQHGELLLDLRAEAPNLAQKAQVGHESVNLGVCSPQRAHHVLHLLRASAMHQHGALLLCE
mmetsp:Transcript_8801/g.20694  ORF Transcript_8801/g.20694 Transcript_8801/m.20694 type:complete len:254 (+) Transcript_8801:50-811(+)